MFPKYSRSVASSTSASMSPRTSALARDLAATEGSTRLVSASLSKRPTSFQAETSAPVMFAQVDRLVKIVELLAAMSGAQKTVLKLDAFALLISIVLLDKLVVMVRIALNLIHFHALLTINGLPRELDLICPFMYLAPKNLGCEVYLIN